MGTTAEHPVASQEGDLMVRIYLAGRVAIESSSRWITAEAFPSQQVRLAFACLVLERGHPVARSELAEVLWPREMPSSSDNALNALISKLRTVLVRLGPHWNDALVGARGTYELRVPERMWVDLEAAAEAIHAAETAMRLGHAASAYGPSAVAHHIARRPFFPGEQGPWVEARRDRLRDIRLRALEVRAQVYLANAEPALALQSAKDIVAVEPFREAGHRLVIRAHAAMGNTAEALRAYEQCRRLIAAELGVDPSPQTKAAYEAVLELV